MKRQKTKMWHAGLFKFKGDADYERDRFRRLGAKATTRRTPSGKYSVYTDYDHKTRKR